MLKIFDIVTPFNYGQIHSVVAESMGEAERAFKEKYKYTDIRSITEHSYYVIIAKPEANHDPTTVIPK